MLETKQVGLRQLAKSVAEKTGITQGDSLLMVKAVFDILKEEIVKGSKITINGFGSFFTSLVGEREAPNPQVKGERITVPAHFKARWKASNLLKEELKKQVPTEEDLATLNK